MKHNAFGDQSEKFLVRSFVILLIFFYVLFYEGNHRFVPTSPFRDYGDSQSNKHRRSRSASVRFVNEADNLDQVQSTNASCFPKQATRCRQALCFYVELGHSDDAAENVSAMKCAFSVTCHSSLGSHLYMSVLYKSVVLQKNMQMLVISKGIYENNLCIFQAMYEKEKIISKYVINIHMLKCSVIIKAIVLLELMAQDLSAFAAYLSVGWTDPFFFYLFLFYFF